LRDDMRRVLQLRPVHPEVGGRIYHESCFVLWARGLVGASGMPTITYVEPHFVGVIARINMQNVALS